MAVLKRVAPIFGAQDVDAALAFYRRLGFRVRAYPGGGYGFVARDDVEIHVDQLPEGAAASGQAYIWVDDADEVAATCRSAGADVRPPEDTPWGQHEGALVDPDGNVIRFGSPIG